MDASDSQLSDIIKQGKLNESVELLGRTQEEFNQFSQNTRTKIENGEYLIPELSQNSADIINLVCDSPQMDQVRHMIEGKTEDSFEMDLGLNESLPFSDSFSKYESQSQKKRTARIFDELHEKNNNARNLSHAPSGLFNYNKISEEEIVNESILDKATHELDDSFKITPADQSAGLLSLSFESNLTVTQKFYDSSQSPVPYLRSRTEDEQIQHNLKKKAMKAARVEKDDYGFEPMFQSQTADPAGPVEQPIDYSECDIFANDEEDSDIEEKVIADVNPSPDPNKIPWISLSVNEKNVKKISDCALKTMPNGDTFLWAKSECDIPLEVKWDVPAHLAMKSLALRVRFVNYDRTMPLSTAMSSAYSDVKKCRMHIEKEAVGVPAESFFYISSPGAVWKPSGKKYTSGHYFRTVVPAGVPGMDFYIKFSCQEKCMDLSEKRKKMCLVVFLEEEVSRELIAYACFREVRIVAYPRRDFKNFCEKQDNNESKHSGPPSSLSPIAPFHQPSTSTPHRFSNDMHNVTNQMLPSTSTPSRKRHATDASYSSSRSMPPIARKSEYQKELLLGRYGRMDDDIETMDVQIGDENEQNDAKRSRSRQYPYVMFAVPVEEAEDVAEFLADRAQEARAIAMRTSSARQNPLMMQINMNPETTVLSWLSTIEENSHYQCFQSNRIYTIGDLIEKFEIDPEVFENIGIPSEKLKKFNDLFLNYYRVYAYERLKEQRRNESYRRRYGL